MQQISDLTSLEYLRSKQHEKRGKCSSGELIFWLVSIGKWSIFTSYYFVTN